MEQGRRHAVMIGAGVVILVALLFGAAYLASTLWPKVVVVEQKAVGNPPGAVGPKPGLQPFDELIDRVCPAIVEIAAAPAPDESDAKASGHAKSSKGKASDQPPPPAVGFLLSSDGAVAAAASRLGDGASFVVTLNDGRSFTATRTGDDPLTGLALLHVPATGLPFLRFAGASFPRAGQWVVAVESPAGLGCIGQVSTIAADSFVVGEERADYLELHPDLDPIAIGAPVFNAEGRVVGIAGLGLPPEEDAPARYVLPANLADRRIDALQHNAPDVGPLGLIADDLTPAAGQRFGAPDQRGAFVALVAPGSPADEAGVRVGDLLVSANNQPIARADDLAGMSFQAGSTVALAVTRRGQALTLSLALPAAEPAKTGKTRGS
ncbi:MAG TPA: S1C family serine protease [Sphingomonas sp.]|nr:S1C family serine protease [Sphingomonas sp.]